MSNELRDYAVQLMSGFAGQEGVLVIQRPFLTACDNDHRAALLLSQCVYWSDRTKDAEGWFAKSYVEWFAELGLTEYEVRRAARLLADMGLDTKLKKFNGAPVVHYRIDKAKFSECILKKLQKPFLSNSRIDSEETQETLTEITTETTTNTKDKDAPSGALPATFQNENPPAPIEADAVAPYADWLPLDQLPDTPPVEAYPCTAHDITALIAAWWDWVPLRPTRRGVIIPAKQHYANTTIRDFAQTLTSRGVLPADMIRLLGEIRLTTDDSRYAYLRGKELPFNYVGEVLLDWVAADRADNWYTAEAPRITARKPGTTIRLGEISEGVDLLARFANDPTVIVDIPQPFLLPQTPDDDATEGDSTFQADDATLLAELATIGIDL